MPVPDDRAPVENVEDDKENGEEDKEGEVSDGVVVLLPLGPRQLPHLHLEQDASVLDQSCEHEDYASYQPSLYCCQSISLEN